MDKKNIKSFMTLVDEVKKIRNELQDQITFDENLSKFSWFNLGGPAKIVFRPKSLKDLSFFLKNISANSKIKVLGVGSNTLIRDGGFDGIIIRFGKAFSHISLLKNNLLISGAGTLDKKVSDFALNNSLSGFEFLSCIPGTIGGAIKMNSGCYSEDISKILLSVQAIDLKGSIRVIPSSDINFHYRGSNLADNLIFISATFKGETINKADIKKKMEILLERKKKSQPSKIKTCGSTFKNPKLKSAWQLIKETESHRINVGNAKISEKHCNFFVNTGKASSADLEKLINKVKKNVLDRTGIELELELQIIGEHKKL